jgi:hypothetical protein
VPHHDQEQRPIDVNDGTMPRSAARRGIVYLPDESISLELNDAPRMCVPTSLNTISLAQVSVLAWLRKYATAIVEAEHRFSVDRRAIAGVIAWEALKNVQKIGMRAVGAGKSHLWDFTYFDGLPIGWTHETLVAQVEEKSVLPRQTVENREKQLKTAEGSITYIAAAMSLAADMVEEHGFPSIRRRPDVLAYFWNSQDLRTWEKHLKAKKPGEGFFPLTDMAKWVQNNNPYLVDAVGKPDWSVLETKRYR